MGSELFSIATQKDTIAIAVTTASNLLDKHWKIHNNIVTASLISRNQFIKAMCNFQQIAHHYMGYKESQTIKYIFTITAKRILKRHGCFLMPTKPRQDTSYSLKFIKHNITKHIKKIITASYLLKPFQPQI